MVMQSIKDTRGGMGEKAAAQKKMKMPESMVDSEPQDVRFILTKDSFCSNVSFSNSWQ
jgi:hypothetical protein